jgi:hypothetical protein
MTNRNNVIRKELNYSVNNCLLAYMVVILIEVGLDEKIELLTPMSEKS